MNKSCEQELRRKFLNTSFEQNLWIKHGNKSWAQKLWKNHEQNFWTNVYLITSHYWKFLVQKLLCLKISVWKNCWSKINFLSENVSLKIFLGWKKFLVPLILDKKNLASKNIWSKNIGGKKIWVKQNLSLKICRSKITLVQKIFPP